MIGIIINVLSVALGGLCGLVFGKKMTPEFTASLNMIFGVCAMTMGISTIIVMQNMPAALRSTSAKRSRARDCCLKSRSVCSLATRPAAAT